MPGKAARVSVPALVVTVLKNSHVTFLLVICAHQTMHQWKALAETFQKIYSFAMRRLTEEKLHWI